MIMSKEKDLFLEELQGKLDKIYHSDKLDEGVKDMVYNAIMAAYDMELETKYTKQAKIANFHN